jgi:hypothetical protein
MRWKMRWKIVRIMTDPITTLGLAKTTTELVKEATALARAAKEHRT